MSKRSGGEKQEDIWIAHTELAVAPGHPFYKRLNQLLEGSRFDEFVEGLCVGFYHARLGRPSLRPGIYFRALLVGYFEGIDSERGIAWRLALEFRFAHLPRDSREGRLGLWHGDECEVWRTVASQFLFRATPCLNANKEQPLI